MREFVLLQKRAQTAAVPAVDVNGAAKGLQLVQIFLPEIGAGAAGERLLEDIRGELPAGQPEHGECQRIVKPQDGLCARPEQVTNGGVIGGDDPGILSGDPLYVFLQRLF